MIEVLRGEFLAWCLDTGEGGVREEMVELLMDVSPWVLVIKVRSGNVKLEFQMLEKLTC